VHDDDVVVFSKRDEPTKDEHRREVRGVVVVLLSARRIDNVRGVVVSALACVSGEERADETAT